MANPAKVTLICGISGVGKTYLSRRIAESEGAVRLSTDERMWERYGRFTELSDAEQRRLTMSVEKELIEEMSMLLRRGQDVVIDSCLCKRFKREAFSEAARDCGASVDCIYLTAPRAEILARLSRRRGKDANDIRVSEEAFERFERHFEVPSAEEGFRKTVSQEKV